MAKRFWWPGSIPEQLIFIEHFSRYTDALGLTPDQAKGAEAVSAASLSALNPTDHLRNHISFGRSERLPTLPFPYVRPAVYTIGLGSQFFELRDEIVTLSEKIGSVEYGANLSTEDPGEFDSIEPPLPSGYWVIISGSTRSKSTMPV